LVQVRIVQGGVLEFAALISNDWQTCPAGITQGSKLPYILGTAVSICQSLNKRDSSGTPL